MPRQRSGRLRATTARMDRALRREVLKKPFITAAKLKRGMVPLLDSASVRTIQHRLQKDMYLPARKPTRKPLVTLKMKQSRLEFCHQHTDWTVENWKTVMFSDESTFKQFDCLPQVVRRPPGSPLDPSFTSTTIKHSPGVMVWGCFSIEVAEVCLSWKKHKKMNSDEYIKILDDELLDFMGRHDCTTFQQDKSPCHSSRRTMAWFDDNDVRVLSWPGNSPDLNPMENL